MVVWATAWRTSDRARGLQRLDPPDLALGCLRPLPRDRAEGPGASHSGRRTWTGRTSSSSGRRSSRPGKASASTGAPTCRSGTSHPVASQRPAGSWTATAPQAPVCPLEQGACRVMLLLRVWTATASPAPVCPLEQGACWVMLLLRVVNIEQGQRPRPSARTRARRSSACARNSARC